MRGVGDLETALGDQEQLEDVLDGISMSGTRFQDWSFDWSVTQAKGEHSEGWFIQSSFERPDVDGVTPAVTRGFGREWYVKSGASLEGVVFTAWLAIRQVVEHELHESFTVTVGGERVRLLDPHKRLEDVAVGSRRV